MKINKGTDRRNVAASGSNPGVAYLCSITGEEVAYAGGGSGSYGGGGNSNSAGGGGVVIVRYQMPDKGFVILFR